MCNSFMSVKYKPELNYHKTVIYNRCEAIIMLGLGYPVAKNVRLLAHSWGQLFSAVCIFGHAK